MDTLFNVEDLVASRQGPELTVLSFGGGQDSTALLYKLARDAEFRARYAPGRLLVVMADTGNEHDETLAHVRKVRRYCRQNGLEFVHITKDMGYHTAAWQTLEQHYESGNRIGSKSYPKTCTDNLKIRPIYKFLEDWLGEEYGVRTGRKRGLYEFAHRFGKIRVLIGMAADEQNRVGKQDTTQLWMARTIERVYPLVDLGWDRGDCQQYISRIGQQVPIPSHCQFCPFKTDAEVLLMARTTPEKFRRWVELEENKIKANELKGVEPEKNHGVFGQRRLPEVLAEAELKYADWTDADLHHHRMTHGHCVASSY